MRKHTPDEIVATLRSVEQLMRQGLPAGSAVQASGVTPVTYYRWRKQFGGLSGDQAKCMSRLQAENAHLRRIAADLALDRRILLEVVKESVPTSVLRRALVDRIQIELGISERRACRVLGQHRSTQRKKPKLLNRCGPAIAVR